MKVTGNYPTLRKEREGWGTRLATKRMCVQSESMRQITAIDIAGKKLSDQKSFRRCLRKAKLKWHDRNSRWIADENSPEHDDMKRIYEECFKK